jgi:predicted nucleic acid-binding protein
VIFDTNAVSAFADANAGVLQRLQEFSTTISLPVVVLGEYRDGLKSSRQRSTREKWLDDLEANCSVLDITAGTSRVYAEVRHELRLAGQPFPKMICGSPPSLGNTSFRF